MQQGVIFYEGLEERVACWAVWSDRSQAGVYGDAYHGRSRGNLLGLFTREEGIHRWWSSRRHLIVCPDHDYVPGDAGMLSGFGRDCEWKSLFMRECCANCGTIGGD